MTKQEKQRYENLHKLARLMYVKSDMSQKEIAADLEVSEQAIVDWKQKDKANGDDWDKLKTNIVTTNDSILHELREELQAQIRWNKAAREDDDPETTPDSQAIVMLTKSIHYLETKTGPGQMYETCTDLLKFLLKENPALAKQLHPYTTAFIKSMC